MDRSREFKTLVKRFEYRHKRERPGQHHQTARVRRRPDEARSHGSRPSPSDSGIAAGIQNAARGLGVSTGEAKRLLTEAEQAMTRISQQIRRRTATGIES